MPATTIIEAFRAVGIEGRIDNGSEVAGTGLIAAFWGRFFREAGQIPNRADANTVALYTDYESDEHGAYTFFIGVKVTSTADVPEGMVVREVPAGRYGVFTSEPGPLGRVVPETWQRIWSEPKSDAYTRSFQTDFELYDTRAADPTNGVVAIYIGLQ